VTAAGQQPSGQLLPVHVAVIDDDAAARRMMRRALERRGHHVSEAANGQLGVELVFRGGIDVVLLDMRMPGELNGLDVVARIRASTPHASLPIIVVSASARSELLGIGSLEGCTAFVAKPVDFGELEATISSVLTP
jgi:CheY-like chemotaxis protein